MRNMDPVMEPIFTKNNTLSQSRNPENDTLFSGTSPYRKIYEYPHPGTESVAAFVQLCLGTGHSTNGYVEIRLAPSLFRGESASRNIVTSAGA